MYPEPGTLVRVTLNNNLCIEGEVDSWDEDTVILNSSNSNNQLVIYNPNKNIVFVKLIFDIIPEGDNAVENRFVSAPMISEDDIEIEPNEQPETIIEKHKNRICGLREKIAKHISQTPLELPMSYTNSYGTPDFRL